MVVVLWVRVFVGWLMWVMGFEIGVGGWRWSMGDPGLGCLGVVGM